MTYKSVYKLLLVLSLLLLASLACSLSGGDGPPNDATLVNVVANTSLGAWLTNAVATFNETGVETAEGNPVYVTLELVDSGEAIEEIQAGELIPDLWLPSEKVWINVLADKGNSNFQTNCISVATSPLVIAMWRPVAEALGWPGLPLGWLDIGSLAGDPSAWNYYSGGNYGETLRLGHTHPGLSESGVSTLLAIIQAAQSKSDAVNIEDIQQPIVQASVSAFEAAVSWFSSNTADLGRTMADRGNQFLGAAVMYESDVVANGAGTIVPIYPFEGTFVANHPACINQSADAEIREATGLFRDFLLSDDAQRTAMSFGLRPANPNVELGPPLDESRGVNLDEPLVVFEPPAVETLYAAQDLWQSARKDVNLVMLLDVSGSMEGQKIEKMRQAAVQFIEQMGDEDIITIIPFSDKLPLVVEYQQVGPARDQIINSIERLDAGGDTALYDAIGEGARLIANSASPNTTNALVVLTDGQDTYSSRYSFNQELINLAGDNNTTVFTIAYGEDADRDVLSRLAYGANGNFFLGDEASIAAIYDEMSAAFGGNVGVGR